MRSYFIVTALVLVAKAILQIVRWQKKKKISFLYTHLIILRVTETAECYFYWQKLLKIFA